MRAGVVVPIRAFALGKARLADDLDAAARAELGRRLADRVLDAAEPLPVVVVTSADDVRSWARARGVEVIDDPGSLDGAADAGRAHFAGAGHVRVVIAHADLPHAHGLAALARDASRPIVTLVPCHRDDGSNIVSVPVDVPFRFAYGIGSFRRHAAQARANGLGVRIVRDARLAFDVDLPSDLEALSAAAPA